MLLFTLNSPSWMRFRRGSSPSPKSTRPGSMNQVGFFILAIFSHGATMTIRTKVALNTEEYFILNPKYMENKFKKGIVLGSILAVAGIAFGLSRTKKGQELTEDMQKDLKALAKKLKKRLAKLEDISKEKYEEAVKMVTEEYAKKKEMALDTKEKLMDALKEKWSEAEEEYEDDDEEDDE